MTKNGQQLGNIENELMVWDNRTIRISEIPEE